MSDHESAGRAAGGPDGSGESPSESPGGERSSAAEPRRADVQRDDPHDVSSLLPDTLLPDLMGALFEQSPFSIVVYDMTGHVLGVNRAFTSVMGLTLEQLPADYSILTDPQLDPDAVMPLVRRAFAGEAVLLPPVRYDAAVYSGAGRHTWTQAQLYPVRDPSGAPVRVVLVHIDLTARIEAEVALEASRNELNDARHRLAAILDSVSSGITVQDASGQLVYSNDGAARIVGFASASEFLAAGIEEVLSRFEMLDESGAPLPMELLPGRRAARGEIDPEMLVRYRVRATGEERWSHVRSRAIPSLDREPGLVVNVFTDVTAERRHQQELEATTAQLRQLAREQERTLEQLSVRSAESEEARRESEAARRESEEARREAEWSEAQWRFLAEASRVLSTSLDVETTLSSIARLAVPGIADWCTIHVVDEDGGVRRLEVAHADPARLHDAMELERRYPPQPEESAVHRVVASGRPELYGEISNDILAAAAKDADHLALLRSLGFVSAMIVPLRARERILGALTLIAAESDRRYDARDLAFAESLAERAANAIHTAELYHAAHDANRAKSEFLAVMSHELRTPLNAILGYTDLLTGGISGTLNDTQQAQLDRIDASARHLTELIDTVLTFARIEAGRDEVRITDVDAGEAAHEAVAFVEPAAARKDLVLDTAGIVSVPIRTDVAKLRQILLNLLSNAVKFTSRGSITVTTARDDHCAIIRVADTGIGIPAEDVASIWEPFSQLGPALTRVAGGTGLGLPVSASLAGLLGGSIGVTSEPGKGSVFEVRLPLQPAPGEG